MISRVMDYCNNHFPDTLEIANSIETDGIIGLFGEDYVVGQYVYIHGSKINDGVYKVISATSSKITVDATLTPEDTDRTIYVIGCAIPKSFLDLVAEIEAYETNNSGKDGIASETISRYSVSYVNGGGWNKVFSSKLSKYRAIYDPVFNYIRKYQDCNCSGW